MALVLAVLDPDVRKGLLVAAFVVFVVAAILGRSLIAVGLALVTLVWLLDAP